MLKSTLLASYKLIALGDAPPELRGRFFLGSFRLVPSTTAGNASLVALPRLLTVEAAALHQVHSLAEPGNERREAGDKNIMYQNKNAI